MTALHLKTSFEINELNKKNTFANSPAIEFTHQGIRFAFGFWTAEDTQTPVGFHPFLALIAWTPDGWEFIAKMGPIWNDELAMFMGSDTEDMNTYLWFIGETMNEPFRAYLAAVSGTTIPDTNWEKLLENLRKVFIENDKIKFPPV
ncbi:MAG: hypothetical protein JKY88_09025 [Pseudomonadales bacterium]|nr:hypothetical protein [Pseudomonadales bacterium]